MNTADADSTYPTPRALLRHPVHFLSLGLGSGCMRKAPGTWGSVAALPVYGLFYWLPFPLYALVLVVSFAVGVWLCHRTAEALGVHDHPAIVWDEFVGMWIALALQPTQWWWIGLAFVLFRLFDIWKPWPISWLDKRVSGGMGIMVDDVLAGLYALLALWLIQMGVGAV